MRLYILVSFFFMLRLVDSRNSDWENKHLKKRYLNKEKAFAFVTESSLYDNRFRIAKFRKIFNKDFNEGDINKQNIMAITNAKSISSKFNVDEGIPLTFNNNENGADVFNFRTKLIVSSMSLCTRHHEMFVMCDCHKNPESDYTTSVGCYLFTKDLKPNDPIWYNFSRDNHIRNLSIFVQRDAYMDFIPSLLLTTLPELEVININYANISKINENAFEKSKTLKLIQLNNDGIQILGNQSFANLPNLREIDLRHNAINTIEKAAFKNLPNLENLYLGFNGIEDLDKNRFQGMENLLSLDLSHNRISRLENESFTGMSKLQTLKLNDNKLSKISNHLFTELWSLAQLNLDNNEITIVGNRAFNGLINISEISLRNNKISELADDIFLGLPSLHIARFDNNSLTTVNYETFKPMLENLNRNGSAIGLADNKLVCNCKLKWIYALLNNSYSESMFRSLHHYTCELENPKQSDFIGTPAAETKPIIKMNNLEYQQNIQSVENLNRIKKGTLPENLMSQIKRIDFSMNNTEQDSQFNTIKNPPKMKKTPYKTAIFYSKKESLVCDEEPMGDTELPLDGKNGIESSIMINIWIAQFVVVHLFFIVFFCIQFYF